MLDQRNVGKADAEVLADDLGRLEFARRTWLAKPQKQLALLVESEDVERPVTGPVDDDRRRLRQERGELRGQDRTARWLPSCTMIWALEAVAMAMSVVAVTVEVADHLADRLRLPGGLCRRLASEPSPPRNRTTPF